MATTLATFYATYKNLALTDVTSLDEAPQSVASVKLPCKWVDVVGMDEGQLRAKGVGGDRTFRGRLVVAVAALGLDTQANRWADALAMVDTLNAGIKSVADRSASWSIDVSPNFAERYFAVVATIEEEEGMV